MLMNMTSISYSHFSASSYQMLRLHTDTTSPTLHLIWFVIPKNLCPAKFSWCLLIIWENTQDFCLFLINGDKLMDDFQKGLPWDRQPNVENGLWWLQQNSIHLLVKLLPEQEHLEFKWRSPRHLHPVHIRALHPENQVTNDGWFWLDWKHLSD